jgi:hypothetical protein
VPSTLRQKFEHIKWEGISIKPAKARGHGVIICRQYVTTYLKKKVTLSQTKIWTTLGGGKDMRIYMIEKANEKGRWTGGREATAKKNRI